MGTRQPVKLYLAPMEGVGSLPFRKAITTVGGFDEACTEFIRVPSNAHIPSLAKKYNPNDTFPIPQAAQIMGSDTHLMADMARTLAGMGAPRVDLNCGCPSNTVNGRGAGASLLKEPRLLHDVAKSMVDACPVPVTAKLRSGFEDTSLFTENLLAAQESGIAFLTLHPRTKKEGYKPPANWDLIRQAKELLDIPIVGNGDINSPEAAHRMLEKTGCDALMIGRGAVTDPFIFHSIKASFGLDAIEPTWEMMETYIETFIAYMPSTSRERNKINHVKQLFHFLFMRTEELKKKKLDVLRCNFATLEEYVSHVLPILEAGFFSNASLSVN